MIGISVMVTTLPAALLIARECKKLDPKVQIVLGGPEVSTGDLEVMRNFEQVDSIVRGEGEKTLLEILEAIKARHSFSGIPGLTFRANGEIIRNPDREYISDLDALPYLQYDLLPYVNEYDSPAIEGGRGCPYNCEFCSTSKMWGQKFRIKTPARLTREISRVSAEFKRRFKAKTAPVVSLIHDNLLANKKIAYRFLNIMAHKKMRWACSARLDHLDEKMVNRLKAAGCSGVFIGVESASPRIQQAIKKNLPVQKLPAILEELSKNRIIATLSYMIGLPEETPRDLSLTLLSALRSRLYDLPPRVQYSILCVLRGSGIYNRLIAGAGRGKLIYSPQAAPLRLTEPALERMIKKYPKIFSAFYCLRRKHLISQDLCKIDRLFYFLTKYYPLTTLLMINHSKLSAYQWGMRVIDRFEKWGIDWKWESGKRGKRRYYLAQFNKYLKEEVVSELIYEAFAHERTMNRIGESEIKAKAGEIKLTLSSRPIKNRDAIIRSYKYPIHKAGKAVKNNTYNLPAQATCLGYVPNTDNKLMVPLDQLALILLRSFNGRNSLRSIIDSCRSQAVNNNDLKIIKKAIMREINFLYKNGLIVLRRKR